MNTRTLRALAALALAGLLAACGGSDAPPTEVSKTIGAAGGTLDGPDGVQLVVPPGALAQDTVLKIARVDGGGPAVPTGFDAVTPVYEFTPHGQTFLLPVTVRMPMASTAGVEFEDALMASPGEPWQAMSATVSGGMAQWQRMSLSYGFGAACAIKAGDRDPYPCSWPSVVSNLSATPADALAERGGLGDFRNWAVDKAFDLDATVWLRAPADCTAAQYLVRRIYSGTKDGVLRDWTPVALNPDPANAKKILGVVNFNARIDSDWNGRPAIGIAFRCTRLYDNRTLTAAFTHHLVVSAPTAPPPPPSPVISAQPADQSVYAGDPASFSVAATASGTLTIAWERSNDAGGTWTSTGATGATLSLPAVVAGDHGARFRAQVCNVVGGAQRCVTSDAAVLSVAAPPGDVVAYEWDFDHADNERGAPGVAFALTTTVLEDTVLWDGEGFKGLGPAGNRFADYLLRLATGQTITLELDNLPPHQSLSLQFLFAAIDSLDGSGTFPAGDVFTIEVDGVPVLRESFANATPTQIQSYVPPPGGELARRVDLGFTRGEFYLDSAYNMAVEPRLQRIPHTGSRVVITLRFDAEGAQGLFDESWGMDNLKVILHP